MLLLEFFFPKSSGLFWLLWVLMGWSHGAQTCNPRAQHILMAHVHWLIKLSPGGTTIIAFILSTRTNPVRSALNLLQLATGQVLHAACNEIKKCWKPKFNIQNPYPWLWSMIFCSACWQLCVSLAHVCLSVCVCDMMLCVGGAHVTQSSLIPC